MQTRSAAVRLIIATVIIFCVEITILELRSYGYARPALLLALPVFAALVWWCRRSVAAIPIWAVIAITVCCQLPGLFYPPALSDDVYRYIWDGRVQLAGIDPYRYPPIDPALDFLRDPILFPDGPGSLIERTVINRPWVRTIYPPVAQLWFAAVALITPWSVGVLGIKIAAALLVVGTTAALSGLLPERRGHALLYGACPATCLEAANSGHIDVLVALLLVGLGWAVLRRRHLLAGLLLGLAAGVKLVPLLLLPVFLRRQSTVVTSVITLVAGYLPHLMAVGSLVLGFLPGYLAEEGFVPSEAAPRFDGRRRFALLIWLPEQARLPVALAIAAGLAVLAMIRSRTEPTLVTCCWLYGCSFLVATPAYPWYLLPFIVVVIMARRPEWLVLWPAAYLGYLQDRDPVLQTVGFGAACVIIVAVNLWRYRIGQQPKAELPSAGALNPARW